MSAALIALTLSTAAAPPHLPTWPAKLQSRVMKVARGFDGQIHLQVEDLQRGGSYGLNADTPAYLASGTKIVVMLALYQAIAEGRLSLEDAFPFRVEDVRDGAPLTSYLRPGTPVPLGLLLEAMIQSSDNGATDAVIRAVGLDAVNRALAQEGLTGFGPVTSLVDVRRLVYRHLSRDAADLTTREVFGIRMARPLDRRLRRIEDVLGLPAGELDAEALHRAYVSYYREGWNSASMRAMARLLGGLARGQWVSRAASEAMVDVMRGTRTGLERIRAGLPSDVVWAHKTGTQHHRTCDFGIAYLPPDDRPVVIAASISTPRRAEAERVLAALGRAIHEVLTDKSSPRSRRDERRFTRRTRRRMAGP